MANMKRGLERKSVNRGVRMKPSVLDLLRKMSNNKSTNQKIEYLILEEAKRLNLIEGDK